MILHHTIFRFNVSFPPDMETSNAGLTYRFWLLTGKAAWLCITSQMRDMEVLSERQFFLFKD